jgi:hypothetical protein
VKSVGDFVVNIVRSTRWPGATTVAKGGKFCNIYVGDACKHGDKFFFPSEPPSVLADPGDPEEQPEPQGKEAPVPEAAPVEAEAPAEGGE